jgi:uridine kinase
VRPNFGRFTAASREHADLVIPTERHNQVAVDAIRDAVLGRAGRRQEDTRQEDPGEESE